MSSERKTRDRQTSSASYEKLAHLYRAIFVIGRAYKVNELLELGGDINYQVPESSYLTLREPRAVGNTALHFAATRFHFRCVSMEADILINHGADPTIKNGEGLTAIHQIARRMYTLSLYNDGAYLSRLQTDEKSSIRLLLSAQVRNKNYTNPRDPHGISHFHAACMINDTVAVELFLDNHQTAIIDEAVDVDSSRFPGYTPLHFAVGFGAVEVAHILLNRDTSLLHLKDSSGMTPLHLAIQRYMTITQCIRLNLHGIQAHVERDKKQREDLLAEMENSERVISGILSKMDKATMDSLDLYAFYAMYAFKDASLVRQGNNYEQVDDINKAITMNSAFWPGYSALHFAARVDIDTFKLLLERGADIQAKDVNGDTPFDMCLGFYDVEDIRDIFESIGAWRELLLSNGETKLVDLLRAMRTPRELLASFLMTDRQLDINDIIVPANSPLWPGSTILHLAVKLSKKCACVQVKYKSASYYESRPDGLVEACLSLGADVTIQDLHGSSPLHLAFRRWDLDNIYLLMKKHEIRMRNPADRDNVSHLHIACAMANEHLVKKLVDHCCNGIADVNGALLSDIQWDWKVQYASSPSFKAEKAFFYSAKSTPLHIAIRKRSVVMTKLLLEAGADLDAKDANGLTPIHLLFTLWLPSQEIAEILLFGLVSKDLVISGCRYELMKFPSGKAVEELFGLRGAELHSTIRAWNIIDGNTKKYNFNHITNRKSTTGVRFFRDSNRYELLHIPMSVLVNCAADVLSKRLMGKSPIFGAILIDDNLLKYYTSVMNDDDERRLIEETGVTKLHMACKLYDEKMVRECVKKGANVNAQIHTNSRKWPGYTPLHFLVAFYNILDPQNNICRITRFLLRKGADVTIVNANGETPLLLEVKDNHMAKRTPAHIDILMNALKNTDCNPVSAEGISHFHLACIRNDVALMKKYLKLDVDAINQTVDCFSSNYPGDTPLHFALARSDYFLRNDLPPLRAVNLLLKHGANVHARNAQDVTPLLLAALLPCTFNLPYRRILRAGADPQIKDTNDTTPADMVEFRRKDVKTKWNVIPYAGFYYGCVYPIEKLPSPRIQELRLNKRFTDEEQRRLRSSSRKSWEIIRSTWSGDLSTKMSAMVFGRQPTI